MMVSGSGILTVLLVWCLSRRNISCST